MEHFARQYANIFYWFEVFSVVIFSIEYALRIWSSVEKEDYSQPLLGRLRFSFRPLLLLDLITILPFYLGLIGIDLRFLRSARLFRAFRLLRLARYLNSMQIFARVFKRHREDLITTMFFMLLLLLFSGSLMYFVERHAQPEKFASIPAAMWWAVATLTTVGYGDAYPVTDFGKLIASFIAILGIGMVALPAGILSSGFNEELRNIDREAPSRCPHCKKISGLRLG